MSRPTNKADLLKLAQENYSKLIALIDQLSHEQQNGTFGFSDRDRNIRDVLGHLHEWHKMMAHWYKIGVSENGLPDIPAKGYTWKTIPDLNQELWQEIQKYSLDYTKKSFAKSHQKMLVLIEKHTDAELFSRNIYPFTKTTTLGAYFISSTSSHYDWAIKKIKKYIKKLNVA